MRVLMRCLLVAAGSYGAFAMGANSLGNVTGIFRAAGTTPDLVTATVREALAAPQSGSERWRMRRAVADRFDAERNGARLDIVYRECLAKSAPRGVHPG